MLTRSEWLMEEYPEEYSAGGYQLLSEAGTAQVVYLDFDGETTIYNGEQLTVNDVIVEDSGLDAERIASIVQALNEQFAEQGVTFVTERPAEGEYSTVFVGKTDAFAELGSIRGIAETVDTDNQNQSDNAFVLLDSESSNETIVNTIAHEVGHLLGESHEGEGVEAYLAGGILNVAAGETVNGIILSSATVENQTMNLSGTANNTTVSAGGSMAIAAGGVANGVVLGSDGKIIAAAGGTATGVMQGAGGVITHYVDQNTYISGIHNGTDSFLLANGVASGFHLYSSAYQSVYSGFSAVDTDIYGGGVQTILAGATANGGSAEGGGQQIVSGIANDLVINDYGNQGVRNGGLANNTIISGSGSQTVSAGGAASGTVVRGGYQLTNLGGVASSTVIYNGGSQLVRSGTVVDTVINSGGVLNNSRGGTVVDAVINSGGILNLSSGCILTGNNVVAGFMNFITGAVNSGATVTFDLSQRQTTDGVMINSLAFLTADSLRLRTSGAMTGTYLLAGNANSFGSSLNMGFEGGGTGAVGGFAWLEGNGRYSGAAEDGVRYIIQYDASGNLTVSTHERYELLVNSGAEYVGEDASYTDMRGGTSAGIYAVLNQSYQAMIFGGGDRTVVSGKVTLDVTSGTVLATHLFGGGFGADVDGSTEINLSAGMTANGYVLGGGYNGNVSSNAVINATGGTVNALYGGGRVDAAGASAGVGTVTMTLESGFSALKSNSYVYGGGIAAAAGVTASVTSVDIAVNGASLAYLHGGGQASNGSSTVESVAITVEAGTVFSAYLYGGGRASGSATSTVGEVSLKIAGGSFTYVFGGGYSSASGLSTVDTVKITVSAGTFSGSLYGGAQRSGTGSGTASVGDVNITLDLTGVVDFAANMGVVMGGTTTSVVTGDTTLTLTGSGSNLKTAGGTFTGWLTASVDYGIDQSKTHTLRFADFTDSDFQAQVRGFNHADFSGSSAVTVTSHFGWYTGSDFSFDLTGRSAMSGTAFMTQESGSLGITADSIFNIELGAGDLNGTTGSFLLLDAMDGVGWNFGAECVNLVFGGSTGTGTFNGSAIELEGYLFNLVYEQADGTFQLTWSYDETGSSSRIAQQGILA